MKKKNLILTLILITGVINLFAQEISEEIWQVDSRLELSTKKSGEYRIINVHVRADNDDAARSPKLIVTLPRNSKVTAVTIDDKYKYTTPYQVMGHGNLALKHVKENIDSYVQFDLRNLNKADFNVKISIVPTSDGFPKNTQAAAMIYGITPELNKNNNYQVIQIQ